LAFIFDAAALVGAEAPVVAAALTDALKVEELAETEAVDKIELAAVELAAGVVEAPVELPVAVAVAAVEEAVDEAVTTEATILPPTATHPPKPLPTGLVPFPYKTIRAVRFPYRDCALQR